MRLNAPFRCSAAWPSATPSRPEEQRIQVRIGINLGEVIVEGDDRYGEGVNVAARLQQLADPGGICVSGKVAHEVEKKLAFAFESLGAQHVKNITEPVPVYRVVLDGAAAPIQRRKASNWRMPAVAAVILLVLLGAAGAWYKFLGPASTPVVASGLPSLAVLPFANMSGDPAQDYLGPGVAEEHHHGSVELPEHPRHLADVELHL